MSNPTRIPLIVGGVIGAVALTVCFFLPKNEQKDPNLQNTNPTTGIHIQLPGDTAGPTDPTEKPPVIVIPGDEDPTDPTTPTNPYKPEEGDPFVEGGGDEDTEIKAPGEGDEVIPDDEVIDVGKPKDEEPEVEQGEIRNDEIFKEKEEAAAEDEEEHPEVIVENEEVIDNDDEKGDVVENEETPSDDGESNKNAPEYQPPAGGDNPFDDDTETEIEDTPVEDLIGEGEDRPGEGIHF